MKLSTLATLPEWFTYGEDLPVKSHIYVSDLHLEFNGSTKLLGKAFSPTDVLIVAGDLVQASALKSNRNDSKARSIKKAFQYFKKEICPRYNKVFIVAGNHEHYDNFWQDTIPQMRDHFADTPNVHYMQDDMVEYNGVMYLGCSLWTNFNGRNPMDMLTAKQGMNDYYWIIDKEISLKGKPVPITPEHTWQSHDHSMRWLQETITANPGKPTVVITHHAPTFQSCGVRQHLHPELNSCYASALEGVILSFPQIRYWVHGHTHITCNYPVGNTCFVVSNQCGYPHDYTSTKFKPNEGTFDV